jgi:hypothetical protein
MPTIQKIFFDIIKFLNSLFKYSKYFVYYGYIPLMFYLGSKTKGFSFYPGQNMHALQEQ